MPQRTRQSSPPPRIPALILVPTGETLMINGKRYRVLKLEREKEYR